MDKEPSAETLEKQKPPFKITHLTDSPEGFFIKTGRSLSRREPLKGIELTNDQREQLKNDMQVDVEGALKAALGTEGQSPKTPLSPEERLKYMDMLGAKIGIRNIKVDGNRLTLDIKPVGYYVYKDLAEPENPKEQIEIASTTGTAAILMTTEADGKHQIILQHRSPKNRVYGDIPGASAAGLLDGKFDRRRDDQGRLLNPGRLEHIDNSDIRKNLLNKMRQEVGLEESDLTYLRLVGIAQDQVKVHDEFLFVGRAKLSEKEIIEKAKKAPKSKDERDFYEKFFVIDGKPQTIQKLLTEVKSPLPPTHAAAFLTAGYFIILEKDGKDEADKWLRKTQQETYENYWQIDKMVAESGMGLKYHPDKTPQDQGLPEVTSELKRVGLIS